MASPGYHTYHCICSGLVIATPTPLKELPTRQQDGAHICDLRGSQAAFEIVGAGTDEVPLIIELEDGFEKRYLSRCTRCGLIIGYQLDKTQYEETAKSLGRKDGVIYLLPGGLQMTDDMKAGKDLKGEVMAKVAL